MRHKKVYLNKIYNRRGIWQNPVKRCYHKNIILKEVELGLKNNWKQFVLLVIVNTFVGGMVGMERTILPQLAEEKFNLKVKTAILSFIIIFGV